jgi:hypothetical protein
MSGHPANSSHLIASHLWRAVPVAMSEVEGLMSSKRKRNSADPRNHPGRDELVIVYPDPSCLDESNPPEARADHVTRDEFTRRMAGNPILDTLHGAGRDTRVIMLAEHDAITQWWDTAP